MKTDRKPRVTVVFTGGTISMRFDPAAGGPVPALSGREIVEQVPGLAERYELNIVDFARLPGPHVAPAQMLELARLIRAQANDEATDGVVITHGTDTLEETAYLLDLTLRTEKPVVMVGAMRHSGELGWDGPANLQSAVRVAADSQARALGVLVVMGEQILPASEAVKTHTESTDTFQSRDYGPVGWVDKDRILIARRRSHREYIEAETLEEAVELIKLSAGCDGRLLRHALRDGARGLIVEGLGRGNVPVTALEAMEEVLASSLPIVITSRCPRGRVLDTYAYAGSGKHLKRLGAILGGSLPSHKARIKLMLLLGAKTDRPRMIESFEG